MKKDLTRIYQQLKKKHGRPKGQWSLWCQRPKTQREREEVMMGAILTQRTNWGNVEQAMNNLKKAKINSLKGVYRLGERRLAPLIKSSGFYQAKARYLCNLAGFVIENYGNLAQMKREKAYQLREKLLKLYGLGPETADSILLYALDKPVFVIDEYTRRFVKKRKIASKLSYDYLQELFEENIKRDFALYQDFHALIVIDGKSRVI